MERFEIAEVLDEAWVSTKRHFWHWLLVLVVAVLIPLALLVIATLVGAWGTSSGLGIIQLLGALLSIAGILSVFYVLLGLLRNAYFASQGQKPSISLLLESTRYWWFLVAGAVYLGTVVLGLFFLIIPGLIFAVMFGLFGFALIATRDMNGFAALGMSWDRVSRHFWGYLGLRVIVVGFSVAIVIVLAILQGLAVSSALGLGSVIGVIISVIALVLVALAYAFATAFLYMTDAIAFRRLVGDHTQV